MPDYTVTSTTDSQEAVNVAAGLPPAGEPQEPEQPQAPPEATHQEAQADASDQAEEQPEAKQPDHGDRLQKRIDKLTRRAKEAEEARNADRAEYEQRIKALEALVNKPQAQEVAAPEPAPAAQGRPQRIDYPAGLEGDDAYFDALSDWKLDQREAQRAAQQAQQQAEAEAAKVRKGFEKQLMEVKTRHADFDDSIVNSLTLPQSLLVAIMQLDNGAELAYYLGSNDEEMAKVHELLGATPDGQYRPANEPKAIAHLGRLSARLEKGQDDQQPERGHRKGPDAAPITSAAKKPIRDLKGESIASTVPADQLDYQAFRRKRDEEIRNRYR